MSGEFGAGYCAAHPEHAALLGTMAVAHLHLERYGEVDGLFRRQYAIWRGALGEGRPVVRAAWPEAIEAALRRCDFPRAGELVELALREMPAAAGNTHPHMVGVRVGRAPRCASPWSKATRRCAC